MNALASAATEVALTADELAEVEARVRERLGSIHRWAPHTPDLDMTRPIELTVERLPTLRKVRLGSRRSAQLVPVLYCKRRSESVWSKGALW